MSSSVSGGERSRSSRRPACAWCGGCGVTCGAVSAWCRCSRMLECAPRTECSQALCTAVEQRGGAGRWSCRSGRASCCPTARVTTDHPVRDGPRVPRPTVGVWPPSVLTDHIALVGPPIPRSTVGVLSLCSATDHPARDGLLLPRATTVFARMRWSAEVFVVGRAWGGRWGMRDRSLGGRSCMRWSAGTHVVGGVQAVSEVAAGWARVGLHGADRIGVSAAGWGVAGVSATAGVRAPGNGNLPWRRRPVPASAHAPAPAHALALARSAEPAPVWGVTRIRGRKMKLSGIDSTLLRLD